MDCHRRFLVGPRCATQRVGVAPWDVTHLLCKMPNFVPVAVFTRQSVICLAHLLHFVAP